MASFINFFDQEVNLIMISVDSNDDMKISLEV